MFKQIYRKIDYAIMLLRFGGLKEFLVQLRRHIYSRDIQIGLLRNLDEVYDKEQVKCDMEYRLQAASDKDMKEVFQETKTESKESAYMLLSRKWLYESGCGKWFVARTVDTNEICFLQCVITPEDNKLYDKGFTNWFPRLKEDEIIMEAAYSFEKFRGNHIARPIMFDILEMYKNKGFKRMILYTDVIKEHILKKVERKGFTRFEIVSHNKTLFFSKRKSRPYQPSG